jgi:hypothetical protein
MSATERGDTMDLIERWEIELCADCEARRSTRPYIECQHIGPDDAGATFDVVRASTYQGAVADLRVAVGLLNDARCTQLGTDERSWWRAQRQRLRDVVGGQYER